MRFSSPRNYNFVTSKTKRISLIIDTLSLCISMCPGSKVLTLRSIVVSRILKRDSNVTSSLRIPSLLLDCFEDKRVSPDMRKTISSLRKSRRLIIKPLTFYLWASACTLQPQVLTLRSVVVYALATEQQTSSLCLPRRTRIFRLLSNLESVHRICLLCPRQPKGVSRMCLGLDLSVTVVSPTPEAVATILLNI